MNTKPWGVSEKIPTCLEHALAHLLIPRCVTQSEQLFAAIAAAIGIRHVVNCRNISLSWVNDPCSGWWLFTNPSEKYWCVKLGSYSTILGVKIKMFWNNHLDVSIKWRTLKSNYWGGNFLVGLVNGCSRTLVQSKYLVVGQEECSILFLHCTFPQVQGCMIDTSITYHVNLTSSDH